MKSRLIVALIGLVTWSAGEAHGQELEETPAYRRIRAALDTIPAIDTHDHLWPFDRLPGLMETDQGRGMTLHGLGRASDFPQVHAPTPRRPGEAFTSWWDRARHDFNDARAAGFYRYQVADWADQRPTDDNPRRGLRTDPGTIQLQAHDPQTDVEFRSIRVGGFGDRGPGAR